MKIRKVTLEDAQSISEIYNYYIQNTVITFETEPITASAMSLRIQTCQETGDPFYVLEIENQIQGYAYIHQWDAHQAYSSTKEITVYLCPEEIGKGYGTLLYKKLLESIDKNKVHVLIAGICIPNEGSVKMHEKFGFTQVSDMKQIGKKFNEWRDVGHWQLILK
ncbi:MAG: N-acetyltransferase family protein [Odoribacter sp.]|nr:N-acetyltransferase family protein [Odoribacter sp.]